MIKVEFTIEPFVDGDPPERVNKAVAAVEVLGIAVEIGPFGSSFVASSELVGPAIAALVSTAYEHGATHVSVDTEVVS